MKAAVESELNRLESEGVLKKVDLSDWATLIVAKNGQVRLCGDYNYGHCEPCSGIVKVHMNNNIFQFLSTFFAQSTHLPHGPPQGFT